MDIVLKMGIEFDGVGGIGIYADDYKGELVKAGLLNEGLDIDKKQSNL